MSIEIRETTEIIQVPIQGFKKPVLKAEQPKPAEQKPKEEPKQDNEIEKIISEIKARL